MASFQDLFASLQRQAMSVVSRVHGVEEVASVMEVSVEEVKKLRETMVFTDEDRAVIGNARKIIEQCKIVQQEVVDYSVVPEAVLVERVEVRVQKDAVLADLDKGVTNDPISAVKVLAEQGKIAAPVVTMEKHGPDHNASYTCTLKVGEFEKRADATRFKAAHKICCEHFVTYYNEKNKDTVQVITKQKAAKTVGNTVVFDTHMRLMDLDGVKIVPKSHYVSGFYNDVFAGIAVKESYDNALCKYVCEGRNMEGMLIGVAAGSKKKDAECAFYWALFNDGFVDPGGSEKKFCLKCGYYVLHEGHQERCIKKTGGLKTLNGVYTLYGDKIYGLFVGYLLRCIRPEIVSSGVLTQIFSHYCSAVVQVSLFHDGELPVIGIGVIKDVHDLADYIEALVAVDPKFRELLFFRLKCSMVAELSV
jgi:hypothetical protein